MPSPTEFRPALLAWARGRRPDLPWRSTRDAWRILVSETMLQQTQTSRVAPRYREFVAAYPTPSACAAAPVGDVIRRWQGLGYNRRAVHLHEAAAIIVEEHAGDVPRDLSALLALPGIGPYTARAVMSLAFGIDVGVVDTNVARIIARAVTGRRLTRREAQMVANDLVPAGQARDWNQALMDLGALVCTKRAPDCARCPVRSFCDWAREGWPDPDPALRTAGVSTPQSRFDGSDRQGRGRLVDALRTGPLPLVRVPDAAGWPDEPERARRVADGLVADGLAEVVGDMLALPA